MIKLLMAGRFFFLELALFLILYLLLTAQANHRAAQAFIQLLDDPKLLSAVQNQDTLTIDANLRQLGLDYQLIQNGRVSYQSTALPTPQLVFYQPATNPAVIQSSYAQILAATQAYRLSRNGQRYLVLPLFQSAASGYLVYEKI